MSVAVVGTGLSALVALALFRRNCGAELLEEARDC
jgi:hypothetical protein